MIWSLFCKLFNPWIKIAQLLWLIIQERCIKGVFTFIMTACMQSTYTDDKRTDEGSWKPHFVLAGHQAASNNGGCIAGEGELEE